MGRFSKSSRLQNQKNRTILNFLLKNIFILFNFIIIHKITLHNAH